MIATPIPYISPPSDDFEEPYNPFAPIVMARVASGRNAMLGAMEIGQVRAHDAGKFKACWRSFLPGAPPAPRPVISIEAGELHLAEAIRDWFAACGHPLPLEGHA